MNRDDEPTPSELAEAARLARLVDDLLRGEPPPPVMPAEDRALLDTAARIRAAADLPDARREQILGHVFAPRRRPRAAVPWLVAGMAAAAALVLALRPPRPPQAPAARTADALVGRIAREQAGDARARLDLLYADRLAGYRARLLDGRTR